MSFKLNKNGLGSVESRLFVDKIRSEEANRARAFVTIKGLRCSSSCFGRGVNFGFWSHLRCSGQNGIIFSREGLV